jgi:hypothetical protein
LNPNHNLTKYTRGGFCIFLLLFINISSANLKIAFLDTGFCSSNKRIGNITISKVYDATQTIGELNCPKKYEKLPRFHGEKVLNIFLKNINTNLKLEIYPIIVYDLNGITKNKYWENAINFIGINQINVVVSAVGLKIIESKNEQLDIKNGIWLLAAPRISPFIKKEDRIFPQYLSNNKNVYMFGTVSKDLYVDQGQLYIEKIHSFLVEDKDNPGASFVLPKVASILINNSKNYNLKFEKIPSSFTLLETKKN